MIRQVEHIATSSVGRSEGLNIRLSDIAISLHAPETSISVLYAESNQLAEGSCIRQETCREAGLGKWSIFALELRFVTTKLLRRSRMTALRPILAAGWASKRIRTVRRTISRQQREDLIIDTFTEHEYRMA